MHEVLMPRMDPAMQSGRVVQWLKKEGEPVSKGEPIAVIEGEKTVFEIQAPASGVLLRILNQSGDEVAVAKALALIGESGEAVAEVARPEISRPTAEVRLQEAGPAKVAPEALEERVKISPVARKLAEEHGLDVSKIKATGPGGRIVREDVLAAIDARVKVVAPAAPVIPRIAERIPLVGIRKTVAERLSYSFRSSVPVLITTEVNAEVLLKTLKSYQGLSFTAVIVKAAARSLEEHRALNSSLIENEIQIFSDINVAVAIDTPKGLVAPVIRDANRKPVSEISKIIVDLTERANQGTLSIEELTGSTFTVSNLGPYGADVFSPVINPPNCAILGIGRTVEKPWVVQGSITVKPTITLSLVFDHRITDGVPASKFLSRVKELLEKANQLLS